MIHPSPSFSSVDAANPHPCLHHHTMCNVPHNPKQDNSTPKSAPLPRHLRRQPNRRPRRGPPYKTIIRGLLSSLSRSRSSGRIDPVSSEERKGAAAQYLVVMTGGPFLPSGGGIGGVGVDYIGLQGDIHGRIDPRPVSEKLTRRKQSVQLMWDVTFPFLTFPFLPPGQPSSSVPTGRSISGEAVPRKPWVLIDQFTQALQGRPIRAISTQSVACKERLKGRRGTDGCREPRALARVCPRQADQLIDS